MTDIISCFAGQRLVPPAPRTARPAAPVRPDRLPAARHPSVAVRKRLSRSLHRLAEIIQPDGSIATVPLRATR